MCGLRLHCAEALSDITLPRAKGPKIGDRSAVRLRDGSHGHRVCVDLHSHEACARLGQGCPPSVQGLVRHQAALVSGTRTRVTSGGNLPSLEVIMSRLQCVS
jgi:hypothetical protein